MLVCCDNVGDGLDLGIARQVDREAVTNSLTLRLAAEAKDWERPVIVVRLDDLAHVPKSLLILIVSRTGVVQRIWAARITITGSIVDTCDKADLPTSSEIVNEAGRLEHFENTEDES